MSGVSAFTMRPRRRSPQPSISSRIFGRGVRGIGEIDGLDPVLVGSAAEVAIDPELLTLARRRYMLAVWI
jgi:hypothetical protein